MCYVYGIGSAGCRRVVALGARLLDGLGRGVDVLVVVLRGIVGSTGIAVLLGAAGGAGGVGGVAVGLVARAPLLLGLAGGRHRHHPVLGGNGHRDHAVLRCCGHLYSSEILGRLCVKVLNISSVWLFQIQIRLVGQKTWISLISPTPIPA